MKSHRKKKGPRPSTKNQEPSFFVEESFVQRTETDQSHLICKGMDEISNSDLCANELFLCQEENGPEVYLELEEMEPKYDSYDEEEIPLELPVCPKPEQTLQSFLCEDRNKHYNVDSRSNPFEEGGDDVILLTSGRTLGRTDEQMDARTNERLHARINQPPDARPDQFLDARIRQPMGARMDAHTGAPMDDPDDQTLDQTRTNKLADVLGGYIRTFLIIFQPP